MPKSPFLCDYIGLGRDKKMPTIPRIALSDIDIAENPSCRIGPAQET